MSEIIEIKIPDIGDFAEVEVIEVSVQPGEQVEVEQTLAVLESDKASMDIPSTAAGIVKEVKLAVGDKVAEGTVVILLEVGADSSADIVEDKPIAAPAEATSSVVEMAPLAPVKAATQSLATEVAEPQSVMIPGGSVHATPSVRRFARELGVDLTKVGKGSGRKARILKEDVKSFVKQAMSSAGTSGVQGGAGIPPIPAVDFSKFGEIEEQKLSKIKRLTGINLSRAWLNLPMVTHHDKADITEMEVFRKSLKAEAEKSGIKITGLVFIMKAVVAALKQYPQFNSSLSADGESLIYKKYFNIGIAVDTPNGLVVPVFKDVDRKNFYELSAEMAEMSEKARSGKLMPAEMQGGCMTISSLGGIGGTAFTPIVNAPEVAILGVTRSEMKPVWNGDEFVPRLMLPLDLTYDHRVIDGAAAARFCMALSQYLGDIRRLLL